MPITIPSTDDYGAVLKTLTEFQVQVTAISAKVDLLLARVAALEERPSTSPSSSASATASPSSSVSGSRSPSGSASASGSPSSSVSPSAAPPPANTTPAPAVSLPPTDHAYFDGLRMHPSHYRSYSLRDDRQLASRINGGMSESGSRPPQVTYDARMDAACVRIPAWGNLTSLLSDVNETDTVLHLAGPPNTFSSACEAGRGLRLGSEICVVVRREGAALINGTGVTVRRGQFGTTPVAHAAGTLIETSTNSLGNQVRVPVGTVDPYLFLVTWDGYWTHSYVQSGLANHKAFQLTTGPKDTLWLEAQTRFDGSQKDIRPAGWDPTKHVAALDLRHYMAPLPGVTSVEPLTPKSGAFILHPDRWTRFWVMLDHRDPAAVRMSYWVADAVQPVTQLYTNLPLMLPGGAARTVPKLWLEFNTSTSGYRGSNRDLVSYVRNVVVLKDPPSIEAFLMAPR